MFLIEFDCVYDVWDGLVSYTMVVKLLIDRFANNSLVDVWACSIVFLFGFQAGTGIQAQTIIGLLTEYRGLSWR